MKTFKMKARFKAERFDSANPPKDVTPRMFGEQKQIVVWFWGKNDLWGSITVKNGEWMLIDQYENRSVVADEEFRMLYEEIPNAGESG